MGLEGAMRGCVGMSGQCATKFCVDGQKINGEGVAGFGRSVNI